MNTEHCSLEKCCYMSCEKGCADCPHSLVFVKWHGEETKVPRAILESGIMGTLCGHMNHHDWQGDFRVNADGEIVVLNAFDAEALIKNATACGFSVKTTVEDFVTIQNGDTVIKLNLPAVLSGATANAKKLFRLIVKNATDENIASVTKMTKANAAERFLTWRDAVAKVNDDLYHRYGFVVPFDKDYYVKNATKKEKKAYDAATKKLEAWNEICAKNHINVNAACIAA